MPCFQNKVCQKCEMNFLGQIQTENFWIKKFPCSVTISSPLVSPIFFSQTGYHQSVECSLISLFVQYYYSNLYIDHCHEHVSWTVAIHNILHRNCAFFLIMSILEIVENLRAKCWYYSGVQGVQYFRQLG